MSHLAAALVFTAALLAAAVTMHMTVRLYWSDILLALRGEMGLSPSAPRAQPNAAQRRRAAA